MKIFNCAIALSVLLTMLVACDEGSSSTSVTLSEVEGSSSSVGREKSSSSVKSGDDTQKSSSSKKGNSSSSNGEGNSSSSINDARSSSSGYVLRDSLCSSEYEGGTKYISQYNIKYRCIDGYWVLQSKTCTSEKEGVEAYISQEESWCVCTNGFWIPVSSSSTEPSSSSKYYDMSRLFENENGYSYGEFTDPRDGQVYKTIRYELGYEILDSITFFAQNLNYGKMITGGTQMTDSTKFCYDDDPWYCDNGFGGLYTWATVMSFPAACDSFAMGSTKCPVEYDLTKNHVFPNKFNYVFHQGICPEGWHVMSQEEWAMVMKGSGSRDGASYLGAVLWGSNQRGFSLLPAGTLTTQWGNSQEKYIAYENMREYTVHWIPGDYNGSLVRDSAASYGNTVLITRDRMDRTTGAKKVYGLSVRCTKDY
ncbi:FISUMP domain-containing protein [Fibrobacter sp.]|uniref:FISUMP domain-containing protein n=1 Tax=Fibrobacter sp. TaxID=35828 RepID=UPI00386D4DA7